MVLGASPSWSEDLLQRWMVDIDLGFTEPHGRIRDAFGHGLDGHWAVGRRTFSDVVIEGSVFAAGMDYAAARTVTASRCLVGLHGQVTCAPAERSQTGVYAGAAIGLTAPLKLDGHGRVLQLGAGPVFEKYSVSPDVGGVGTRSGLGVYGKLACDLLRLGSEGGLGVLLRATRVHTSGDTLGTSIPSRTSDTWLEMNLLLRVGGGPLRSAPPFPSPSPSPSPSRYP
jgi:hypothetical protein